MSGFRFSLERLLEMRRRVEDESARRLADARESASRAQEAREALEQARRDGVEQASRATGDVVQAGALQQLAFVVARIDEHLAAAADAIRQADRKVTDLTAEFEQAHARRRVFDKLKEKQHEQWQQQEEQRDRAAMDALALSRHTRRTEAP